MRGLLLNELTKVFKQRAYRIILVIFALIVIATPFLSLAEKALFNMDMSAQELYDSHMSTSKLYSELGDALEADFWSSYAQAVKFFSDNELDHWKLEYLFDGDVSVIFPDIEPASDSVYSYSDYYLRVRAFELLTSGEYTEIKLWMSSYSYCIDDYFYSDTYYFDDGGWYNSIGTPIAAPHTADDVQKMKQVAEDELEALSRMIIDCDAQMIISEHAEHTEMLEDMAGNELELLKLANAQERELTVAQRTYDYYRMANDMFSRLESEAVSLDDWRFDFSVGFLTSYDLLANYVLYPVTREEFLENRADQFYGYTDYEQYLADVEKTVSDTEAGINVAYHAVMNDISPEGVGSPVKKDIREQIVSVSGFVLIFSTVLAGLIVANEFSSGTARLLLIRPKKRWKILFSKLCCVLILHVCLIAVSSVLLVALNMIISGAGDLLTPDLAFVNGRVVEVAAIWETLYTGALAVIQSLLVISLAFALSTLMKKSVLALVIAFVANSAAGVVQLIACMLVIDVPLLEFTVLPYLTLADLRFSASDMVIKNSIMPLFDLGSILDSAGITALAGGGFDPILAIAMVLIHAGALIAVAFASFKKAQV